MNKKSPLYVIAFMVSISVVFGAAIAAVYTFTAGVTKRNEQLNKNRAIARAFGVDVAGTSATAFETAVAQAIDRSTIESDGRTWEVFTSKTPPHNIGFIFKGIGFWDVITGIIVLSPDLSTVVGVRFLEQHETPGLGARIEEPWFIGQFPGKVIAWDAPVGRRLVIGSGPADQRNRIDAITGATQTSQALMRMLNRDLDAFRKALEQQTRLARIDPKEGVTPWP